MRTHRELVARSADDPGWFWPLAIEDMGLEFSEPWDGGLRRLARAGVDDLVPRRQGLDRAQLRAPLGRAHARRARRGRPRRGRRAHAAHVRRALARGHASRRGARPLGVREGDRVALFLPMSPEAAIASHACAHIGAIQVPIFSGFAASAVAQRLHASEAKVAITARESTRRGKTVPMLEILEEARREAPSVEHVIAAPWDELVADSPASCRALEVDSETPYLLTYTSGTTGPPKGVVHVQGGFLVSIAREACYQADVAPGRRRLLRDRHGLDHGAVDGRRRRRARRHGRLPRGRARLAGRPALAGGRAGARHRRSASRRRSPARCSRTATRRTTSRRCARS